VVQEEGREAVGGVGGVEEQDMEAAELQWGTLGMLTGIPVKDGKAGGSHAVGSMLQGATLSGQP
jgi:hypothetical protein